MSSSPVMTLAALRTALRCPAPTQTETERKAATGLAALDELLDGGLPRGRLTEVAGGRSSGRTSLAWAALAAATGRGEATALVDVSGAFDARRGEAAGIELGRLLWVRAGDLRRGLQAAELVLGAGGFGLVVLDAGEGAEAAAATTKGAAWGRGRAPDSAWLRLARAAERSEAAVVVVAPSSLAGSFAALSIETARSGPPRFLGGHGQDGGERLGGDRFGASVGASSGASVGASSRRVLVSMETSVALVRSRRGLPPRTTTVGLRRY